MHGCTDVTGFGLIGHATEMARASGAVMAIDVEAVPLLDGALDLVEANTPGGGRTNQQYFGGGVDAINGLDSRRVQLLYDPQTSGGLLVAVAPDAVPAAIAAWSRAGVTAHQVGSVEPLQTGQKVALREAQGNRETPQTVAVTLR